MRNFRNIKAWKLADDFTVSIYVITRFFPKEELYGLTSQIRRAAYSVASNIAEGCARNTLRDYLHFLYVARASLSEAQYFVHLSYRLQYLNPSQHDTLDSQARETLACLQGLIQAVEKEAGLLKRTAAKLTSSIILFFAPIKFCL